MDKDSKEKLKDKHIVGKRIGEFLENHSKTATDLRGLEYLSNLDNTVKGTGSYISWRALIEVADVCGTTLSELIAYIEGVSLQEGGTLKTVPGRDQFYDYLTAILETKDEERVNGIWANLKWMAGKGTPIESAEGVPGGNPALIKEDQAVSRDRPNLQQKQRRHDNRRKIKRKSGRAIGVHALG